MKKILSYLLALSFSFTTLLVSEEPPPIDTTDTESPASLPPSLYETNRPFPDRTQDLANTSPKKDRRAVIAVLGTMAAITIGLLVSGANTGKHVPTSKTPISNDS